MWRQTFPSWGFAWWAAAWVAAACAADPRASPGKVQFNRDIRPLLSDNCYHCHGPDSVKRQADLRLDLEEGAKADLGGRAAIVPGKPDESELYLRLTSADPTEQMPPPKLGRRLTSAQIDLFRRWIAEGANWQQHWSFIPAARPPTPDVRRCNQVRNPVDAFVLARLESEGLAFAPEADRATLLRRVTFDLTGLPPTPDEVDAFIADESPESYERVVDRLLASPRYGERMAARWLEGARYADTNGYQTDGERYMWRWRDWVIEAFNRNLPFDEFTIEQLAGDMLPHPTLNQQIATGFNRNHRGNGEGGIIPEEFAVEYVVDRVETTFTVWMGLTMGCGRCHDHKFDPLTQRDFYRVFAYFNNIPDSGRANKYGNSPPLIKAPTPEQQLLLNRLNQRLTSAETSFASFNPAIAKAQAAWEQPLEPMETDDWSVPRGRIGRLTFDGRLPDPPQADSSLPRWESGDASYVAGRLGAAGDFDGTRYVNAGDVGHFGFYDRFSLAAWVQPRDPRNGTIVSRMLDEEQGMGYYLQLDQGRVQFNLVYRWLDDALRVESEREFPAGEWHHVLVTYDGSRAAGGVRMYVDGAPAALRVNLDMLNQSFVLPEPLRVGGGNGAQGRFCGVIDDVRIYDRALDADEAAMIAVPEAIGQLAAVAPDRRTPPQANRLRQCFLEQGAPGDIREAYEQIESLRRERERLVDGFSTTMVMEELSPPREAYLLVRGEYDKQGERVKRGVPACLVGAEPALPTDRLEFARWLVSARHPLTARVAVNRQWQLLFGVGLVKSVDDFGAQGEWPSHPELLDWLAVNLSEDQARNPPCASAACQPGTEPQAGTEVALGSFGHEVTPEPRRWDLKRLLRLLVTSTAYRQSSHVTPELALRDPENRLLARGPRLRLSAEMVRDQALFSSGLLVERQGGPSVKPYQPEGLWKELGDIDYVQDRGENLYRRSIYTFWKRAAAPPTMMTFDAAGRETCVVRETRTNTPLQALTLMNDVTFVESSRGLAERAMRDGQTHPERITRAFRLALARSPGAAELSVLMTGWQAQLERFRQDPVAAEQLLSQGELPRDPTLDLAELAAYTVVAGIILNLDETITKE
ncbi:MAG: DUF1553 domain-containing protein [Planctomycetaceae bacterium]